MAQTKENKKFEPIINKEILLLRSQAIKLKTQRT